MKERIFNLYYIIEDGIIRGRAAAVHRKRGSDEEKLAYLQRRCLDDAETAKRYPVPKGWIYVDPNGNRSPGLSWSTYQEAISPTQGDTRWFEDIFQEHDAPDEPLMLITAIVDEQVRIEGERAVR